ncbi:MAG: flagellar motor switch protein FliN [Actinomycetota bacterium]
MTLITELAATNDVAMSVAGAIERVLGDEIILAVGLPREEPPTADVLPAGSLRAARLRFGAGAGGGVLLFLGERIAAALESSSGTLLDSLGPALSAGAEEVARASNGEVMPGEASEIDAVELLSYPLDGEFLVYPLLEGNERVACLVVNVIPLGGTMPDGADAGSTAVAVHEFQPLDGTAGAMGDPRPLTLLADVEMGVTAELGRRRMTVRELLSLTPGSVIELDRAAGTPVDVLVNGTLIARGEVVVIDEEFGIRVSEIVAADAGAR